MNPIQSVIQLSFMSMTKRSQIWHNTSLVDAEAETPVLWPSHAKS